MTRLMMAAAAVALVAGTAQAEDRGMEFRLGVTAHDLADHIEDGPNVTAEILFASPDFLSGIWAPRPYIYGSFNTNGLTNFGAAGLAWNIPVGERWHFEIKEGLSYNDGVVDIDENSLPSDPERIRLATTRSLMGSHYLFHTTFGVDYDFNDRWAIGAYYEHISHGQILAKGRNQALDNAGVRLSYRFGR